MIDSLGEKFNNVKQEVMLDSEVLQDAYENLFLKVTDERDQKLLIKRLKLRLHADRLAHQTDCFAIYFKARDINLPFNILTNVVKKLFPTPVESALEIASRSRLFQAYTTLNTIFNERKRYQSALSYPIQVLGWVVYTASIVPLTIIADLRGIVALLSLIKERTEGLINYLTGGVYYKRLPAFQTEADRDHNVTEDIRNQFKLNYAITHAFLETEFTEAELGAFGEDAAFLSTIQDLTSAQRLRLLQGPKYWLSVFKSLYAAAFRPIEEGANKLTTRPAHIVNAALSLLLFTVVVISLELIVKFIQLSLDSIAISILLAKTLAIIIINIPLYIKDVIYGKERIPPQNQQRPEHQDNSQAIVLWGQESQQSRGLSFFQQPPTAHRDIGNEQELQTDHEAGTLGL